jgi:hypothetical protein
LHFFAFFFAKQKNAKKSPFKVLDQVVNTPQKRRKIHIKKIFSFQRKKLLFFLFFDVKEEKQQ